MTKPIPLAADRVINELIAEITKIDCGFIKGMYLTGSVALNDFHPNKSDIDFLILCNELPKDEFRFRLEHIHKTIEKKFKKPALSGCYITPGSLHVRHAQTTETLCFHEGRMKKSGFEMAPVVLYELKTIAVTVLGVSAQELPVTIELKDVHGFLLKNINTYWKKWVAKRSYLTRQQLLLILFPRLSEWIILGVARQLYTLRTGLITSKTNAGYFCLEHLPGKYHCLIRDAIKIRNDKGKYFITLKSSYYVQPSIKRAFETVECANYIIRLFNEAYEEITASY